MVIRSKTLGLGWADSDDFGAIRLRQPPASADTIRRGEVLVLQVDGPTGPGDGVEVELLAFLAPEGCAHPAGCG